MAFVARGNGSGYFASVSLTDTQGDVSTLKFELTSADFTAAQADTATIVAAVNGVTAATISSISISYVRDEDAFAFPVGADNGVRARMTFQLAGSIEKATLDIPSPDEGIWVAASGPNNNIVDTVDAAVVAYVSLFQAGEQAFLSDGEVSDFLLRGKRTTR